MTSPYTAILFDLDGTIADSAPGITAALGAMFTELGMPVPPYEELKHYLGPPILDSFRDLAGMTDDEAQAALAIYRVHYFDSGILNSSVYPGVADILRRIQRSDIPMSLATSKPETPAIAMLTHEGLLDTFDVITGASDDEVRSAKKDVVAEALIRLAAIGADLSRVVLVGDRSHDVHGAAANGVPTIMVTWGYGTPEEQEGAIAVANTPAELEALLFGDSQ
jgi:phosphoglycolate phosphatase